MVRARDGWATLPAPDPVWTSGPQVPGIESLEYVVAVGTKRAQTTVVTGLMGCHDDHVFVVLRGNRLALASRELDCMRAAGVVIDRDPTSARPTPKP